MAAAIGVAGALVSSVGSIFNALHPERAPIYVGLCLAGGFGGTLLILWANRLLVDFLYRNQPHLQTPKSWMAPSTPVMLVTFAIASVIVFAIGKAQFS